jgi:hypothetical protein
MTTPDAVLDDPGRPAAVAGATEARLDLLARLLDAALQACRDGSFVELARQRPLVLRWLLRPFERCMRGALGDAVPAEPAPAMALCLLRWLVTQLRPDAEPNFDWIRDAAWQHLPAWRPMLAVAAVAGFVVAAQRRARA